jgi:hypothetical protein
MTQFARRWPPTSGIPSVIIALALAGSRLSAQQPSTLTCFRLAFARDSLTAFLPHRIGWDPASPRIGLFWDNLSADAREFRRLTAGQARWKRGALDSVTVLLFESLTESQIALRFAITRDTLHGFLMGSGRFASRRSIPVAGTRVACPDREGSN